MTLSNDGESQLLKLGHFADLTEKRHSGEIHLCTHSEWVTASSDTTPKYPTTSTKKLSAGDYCMTGFGKEKEDLLNFLLLCAADTVKEEQSCQAT